MSQTAKPNQTAQSATANDETSGVDIDALEETVEEVVVTLDVTVQAAEFVQNRSPDPSERERAAEIQQQAEAMLDAAREHQPDQPGPAPGTAPNRTVH